MSTCPCCGQSLEGGAPAKALEFVPLSPRKRRVIEVLAKAHPRRIPIHDLSDLVYSDDPNGGPDDAPAVLRTTICHINRTLAAYGWRISGSRKGMRNGYGLMRVDAK